MRLVTKKIKRFTLLYAELSKYNYNKLASITGLVVSLCCCATTPSIIAYRDVYLHDQKTWPMSFFNYRIDDGIYWV
ncbi:hypothetical protein, partial [Shewanella sp. 30m-9]